MVEHIDHADYYYRCYNRAEPLDRSRFEIYFLVNADLEDNSRNS